MSRAALAVSTASLALVFPSLSLAQSACSNAVLTGGGDLSACTGPRITTGGGTVVFEPLPLTAADRSVRDLAFGAADLALDEAADTGAWVGALYTGGVFAESDSRPDATEMGGAISFGYTFASGFGGYLSFGQARSAIDADNGDIDTRMTTIGVTYANTLPNGFQYAAALYTGQSQTELSGGAQGDGSFDGTVTGLAIRGATDIWQITPDRVLDLVVHGDIAQVNADGYDLDELASEIDARQSTAMALRVETGLPMDIGAGMVRPYAALIKWGGQQDDITASAFGGETTFRAADLYGTTQFTLGTSFDLPESGLSGFARVSTDENQDALLHVSLGLSF